MASDGRFVYHHHHHQQQQQQAHGMAPSYDYGSYPSSSYESAQHHPQYSSSSSASSSSSSAAASFRAGTQMASPAPPHTSSYAQQTYQMPYHQPAMYGAHAQPPQQPPQPQPQWNGQSWAAPYPAPYPPPTPTHDQSAYANNPAPRTNSGFAHSRSYVRSPEHVRPGRMSMLVTPDPPTRALEQADAYGQDMDGPLDFVKLLNSARTVMESANAMKSRPRPGENLEQMINAAAYGSRMLETATRATSREPVQRPARDELVEDPGQVAQALHPSAAAAAVKSEIAGGEGQTCLGCGATSTPEWRRGPLGPRTLCNACGLVYAKMMKKRNRDANSSGGRPAGDDSASASDDEDPSTYAPTDRRSSAARRRD